MGADSNGPTVEELYGAWMSGRLSAEEEEALLDASLHPRGPEMLFDLVEGIGIGADDVVLDAGSRDGRHVIELVRRFGCRAVGIELVADNLDRAGPLLAEAGVEIAVRVALVRGDLTAMPFPDGAFDLVWNRDVMIHVPNLENGLSECRRVLRDGGRMVLFQMFATPWLSADDAARLWPPLAAVPRNADPAFFEAALAAAGWRVERVEHVRSEWREFAEESGPGTTSKQLLRAARLLREPVRYADAMGGVAYDGELANALWGVYQMIGKLAPRVYVLA